MTNLAARSLSTATMQDWLAEDNRAYNHMGEQAYIVTQSIKKLPAEDRAWVLNKQGFKRVSDDKPIDISLIPEDDTGLYYKDEPYTTKDSISA
ncbi:MAG: hypothetical protein ACLSAC_07460 [Enterocloster bolteae]